MSKRNFESFSMQPQRLANDPSKIYEDPLQINALLPTSETDDLKQQATTNGTNFNEWNDQEIISFLDQRGEDFDDCKTRTSLLARARQCEQHTGPATRPHHKPTHNQQDDDIDPLDAFMAEIQEIDNTTATKNKKARTSDSRFEAEDEADHIAEYMQEHMNKRAMQPSGHGAIVKHTTGPTTEEYDSDDEVYATAARIAQQHAASAWHPRSSDIASLAPLDHGSIQYKPFKKDFYQPAQELSALDASTVHQKRKSLGLHVTGINVPAPIDSFQQCSRCFDSALMREIQKAGYSTPTPIQAQALPVVLIGRDVLGIAKTGSGKTAAFILPMMVHVIDQPELSQGEGPIAIIIAPTRELAEQIHRECRKFGKPYKLQICAAFGGLAKHQQIRELKNGSEIAVCTPGRMIDLIKANACTLYRVTYVVLDEADRMFDMGFESQIRSILGQTRPDRHTLLFSATMSKKMEKLATDVLHPSYVKITLGSSRQGTANQDVLQKAFVFPSEDQKLQWLLDSLQEFVDNGDVVVFCNQKQRVLDLHSALHRSGTARVDALHGDMDQATRMSVLSSFRGGTIHVLVATDVAARGLDISSIKTVVNFDMAKDMDTHVHRVGRTGRAGDKEGVAITLLLERDTKSAMQLVQSLCASGQEVSDEVLNVAKKNPKFNYHVYQRHAAKKHGGGSGGGPIAPQSSLPGFVSSPPPPPSQQQQHAWPLGGAMNHKTTSSFVKASSGHIQHQEQKIEIVMPKQASRHPPPPPMVVRHHAKDSSKSDDIQRAIAQAREVAARLHAKYQNMNQ